MELSAFALSLLGVLLTLLDASYLQPLQKWILIPSLLALTVGLLLRRPQPQGSSLLDRIVVTLGSRWLHCDQTSASSRFSHYRETICRDFLLLGFTHQELAKKSGIRCSVLKFLLRFPRYLPRPEYLERLERALMLPRNYFQRGVHNRTSCSDRLQRYYDLGLARVLTKREIKRATLSQLLESLATAEKQIWKDLRDEGKVR